MFNTETHSTSVTYSVSKTSCADSNNKIIACNDCGYSKVEPVNNKHTFDAIKHNIHDYTLQSYIYSVCSKCGSQYLSQEKGNIFKYADGTIVTDSNLKVNKTIYDENGNADTLDWIYVDKRVYPELFDISYTIKNNTTFNVTMKTKMPDKAFEWFSENSFTNSSYVLPTLWCTDLISGYEGINKSFKPNSVSYDASTKTLTSKFSLTLKDYTKNYIKEPGILGVIYLYNGTNHVRYSSGWEIVNINFIDPTISSTSY